MNAIPSLWAKTDLGRCVRFTRGVTFQKEQARDTPTDGYVPVLRAGNLQGGRIIWDDVVYVPESCVSDEQRLRDGDIVVAMSSGSASVVGKAATVTQPDAERGASFGAFCGLWRPLDRGMSRWLSALFQSSEYRSAVSAAALGVNINNLRASHIADLPFAVPPEAEQKRIVAKVEELTARSRRAKEALDAVPPLLDQLRQSILAAAFRGDLTAAWRSKNPNVESADKLLARIRAERRSRWEAAELARIAAKGKNPPDDRWKGRYREPGAPDVAALPQLPADWCWSSLGLAAPLQPGYAFSSSGFCESGVRLLKGTNVRDGWLCLDELDHWNEKDVGPYQGFLLKAGDVVLAMDRPVYSSGTKGTKVAVLDQSWEGALLLQRVGRFQTVPSLLREYLYLFLQTHAFRDHLIASQNGTQDGKDLPHVSSGVVDAGLLPIPPLGEQEAIVGIAKGMIEAADACRASVEDSVSRATFLDSSVLAKAFRGELVPQDSNDEPASVLLERIRAARDSERGKASGAPRRSRSTDRVSAPRGDDDQESEVSPRRSDSTRAVSKDVSEIEPELLQSEVSAALWPLGPLDKDAAVRRVADHLRQSGHVDFERLRADGPLFGQILDTIEAAVKAGRLDRPRRGYVRACNPDATTYTPDDWRRGLVASLGTDPVDRDDAIRSAAEWARDNLGLTFARLREDGHIVDGLRSALNSAIRRGDIIRHDAKLISRKV